MLLFFVSLFCVMDADSAVKAVIDGIHYELYKGCRAFVTATSEDYSRNSYEGNIDIPSFVIYAGEQYTVAGISGYAFSGCKNLKYVSMPNTVERIGMCAFSGSGITSVDIPNSVTDLDLYVFLGCNNLISVNIPNSIKTIHEGAFSGCKNLTSVTIPNSLRTIGAYVFYLCI